MKIELSRIYNNKPYYTIYQENGKIEYALGYERIKKFVDEAKERREKIELVKTKFLEEHSKLIKLIKTKK